MACVVRPDDQCQLSVSDHWIRYFPMSELSVTKFLCGMAPETHCPCGSSVKYSNELKLHIPSL